MPTFEEELAVKLELRARGFDRPLDQSRKRLERFSATATRTGKTFRRKFVGVLERGTKRASSALGKLRKSFGGIATGIAGIVGVAGAIGLGRTLSKAAADFEETQSKFKAVFKDQAAAAEEFTKKFTASVGRSRTETLRFLAAMQDTFVPLGFARGKARELSQEIVKLAVDVASFNNTLDADVLRDFQSALVGNSETVRKYGIIITQSRLNQELLNMGIEGGIRAATDQEKVQARLNLIFQGTRDAQGDAERTAGSFTNQMKRLTAAMEEAQVEAGQKLNVELLKVIESMGGAEEAGKLFGEGLKFLGEALLLPLKLLREIREASDFWSDALIRVGESIGLLEGTGERFSRSLTRTQLGLKPLRAELTGAERQVRTFENAIKSVVEQRAAIGAFVPTEAFGAGIPEEAVGRQFGGPVRGRGVGDRVQASLSPGEFVLRRDAAQALGPALLQALNQAGTTNVSQTFNFQMGGGGDLREQARALMPEFERATRRGLGGMSLA